MIIHVRYKQDSPFGVFLTYLRKFTHFHIFYNIYSVCNLIHEVEAAINAEIYSFQVVINFQFSIVRDVRELLRG